ncbi:S-layer homology domain-containing protein [Butyricicoccus pullicaecorum]
MRRRRPPERDGERWYAKAVRWATDQKIVTGYSNNTFIPTPNRNIT